MRPNHLLAIDQGTTSSRAIVFDAQGHIRGRAQREFKQYFPDEAWVEHDAQQILSDVLTVSREAISDAGLAPSDIAACGITNQRETTVVWDRETGEPIHRAIVWQDRRTAERCRQLADEKTEAWLQEKTGLLFDPYFSATKIAWLLDHVDGARDRAQAGELAFGTIDSWLLWHLTGGAVHATDATNASRTLLFNIREQAWDDELLAFFDIPRALLPEVRDTASDFGYSTVDALGAEIPIAALVGDQQGALVGQACFEPGMCKSTYGTGCFLMLNVGEEAVVSRHRLLTTVAYRIDGRTTYALEGSIFVAGAAIQWLRDALHMFEKVEQTQALASSVEHTGGVYLVPAFTGLGAPYWDPTARGAIFGLTRDTTLVDYERKYVDIHVPDGKPDLLQQIEHGSLALLAQYKAVGHAIPGIIVPDLSQYTHLGDGLTMTDNLIYDAAMSDTESDGTRSGVFDDRWAFTSKSTPLNYGSMAALAAASRAMADYNPALAAECRDTAIAAW